MQTSSSGRAYAEDAAIGLFDSGIGGLTVLRAVAARLPKENFIYLGDTARLPYGTKSPATIRRYVSQNVAWLASKGVKAVVVACNSASTALLEGEKFDFAVPVYNVIEPGAAAAVARAPSQRIGVLGTRATVASGAYERAIRKLAPEAEIFSQACPLLVPLVEEGWENDPITNLVVYRYLQSVLAKGPEALILGCTHYPALKESFAKAAGPGVSLVDSAEAIAQWLETDLASGKLPRSPASSGRIRTFATDVSPVFAQAAARLIGASPAEAPPLELIDLGDGVSAFRA